MKRINLIKYGFVRWPEEDFSDDGSHFTCYRAGKSVRVSKLVSDGQAYLSADSECGNGTLPYEVYSKLPNYQKSNWQYNGVSADTLTDADLEAFYQSCLDYEKEYEAAEAAILYPSLDELKDQCRLIQAKLMREMAELEKIMGEHSIEAAVKFSEWEWKNLKQYLASMLHKVCQYDPDKYPQTIYKKSNSFSFVKPENSELNGPTYYYTYIKELFQKYLII